MSTPLHSSATIRPSPTSNTQTSTAISTPQNTQPSNIGTISITQPANNEEVDENLRFMASMLMKLNAPFAVVIVIGMTIHNYELYKNPSCKPKSAISFANVICQNVALALIATSSVLALAVLLIIKLSVVVNRKVKLGAIITSFVTTILGIGLVITSLIMILLLHLGNATCKEWKAIKIFTIIVLGGLPAMGLILIFYVVFLKHMSS